VSIRLADPQALLLLIPLGMAAWLVYGHRRSQGLLFSSRTLMADLPQTWRVRALRVLPAFFLTGIALGILALARPQEVLSRSRETVESVAIEMAVDVSGSMATDDIPVAGGTSHPERRSRLEAVKSTFADFIKGRPDDLVGLVTFGGYAVTRAPLTFDHDALLQVLSAVEVPRRAADAQGFVVSRD